MTTLIRPSVQRSLDLIPLFANAAQNILPPVDQDWTNTVTRWCDCIVSYTQPGDALAPLRDLTVIKRCGWMHETDAKALLDLQRALTVAGEPLWI